MTANVRIMSVEHVDGRTITQHAEGSDFDAAVEALRKLREKPAPDVIYGDETPTATHAEVAT